LEDSSFYGQEYRWTRRVNRSVAIAAQLVTVAEYGEFLKSKPPGVEQLTVSRATPDRDCPTNWSDWYSAAKYCRWLSEKEGVAEEQMCYPKMSEIKPGMAMPANYLSRTGYRLPTEAEWEYACRAGTDSGYSFGDDDRLLGQYSWNGANAGGRTWPVGQKRPNDFGLFDMHGNVWQWCQDENAENPISGDDVEDRMNIREQTMRVLRAGVHTHDAASERSHARAAAFASAYRTGHGFRVVRTLP
jgi:formylglycine-generating enzyme required for sulfatase activity